MKAALGTQLVLCAMVACGTGVPGRDPASVASCDFGDLAPPKGPCEPLNGDTLFQRICVVDCMGNVYAQTHESTGPDAQMLDLPGGRFYAVLFSPLSGSTVSLGSMTVHTFAGYNNSNSSFLGSPEQDSRNTVPNSSLVTAEGDLFVRINKRMDGPIQLAVFLDDGSGSGYMWRAYAGGVPFAL